LRSESDASERFRKLWQRRLKERNREYLCCSSKNCVSGVRTRVRNVGNLFFCANKEVLEGIPGGILACDDEVAKKCKSYRCKNTQDSVQRDFEEILRSPARCGEEYPKLAIMLWFLSDSKNMGRLARFKECVMSVWKLFTFGWW
jgi:hypothetical protein